MDDASGPRLLALVTGASSGIGLELARLCAGEGYDLLIAADEPSIDEIGVALRARGGEVTALCVDLATRDGVTRLREAAGDRPIDLLLANAGHGLGDAFLDQDFAAVRHVIDTNITGTLDLIHHVARHMRLRGQGRILITGSVAGVMPGAFQAVYHGSQAFIDSFAYALRNELKDSGVTVTVLMPGPTDTHFFERAGMEDTQVNARRKDDPADVARVGFQAMMDGQPRVILGLKHKLEVAAAGLTPPTVLAEKNRRLNQPRQPRRS